MKLNKIFAIALAALSLSACSDDDDFNTDSNVTVEMKESTMQVAEDVAAGVYYYIPIIVNGEANGPITVTVSSAGTGAEPAQDEKDYLITETSIIIPQGQKEGVIEFHPVGDNISNPDRQFTVTIQSAHGAKVGTQNTCLITLLDEDHFKPEAYAKTVGNWAMTTNRGTYPVEVIGYEEGSENYLNKVTIKGIGGQSRCKIEADFSLDATTMLVTLSIPYGQVMATVTFADPFGKQDVLFCGFDGQYLYPSGTGVAVSNVDVNQFTFEQGFGAFFNSGGWVRWWSDLNPVMNKIQ